MQHANGGFSRSFRPKARVRPSTAPDLAVIDVIGGWLADSHHVICCLPRCTTRIRLNFADHEATAYAMSTHREGCHS